jgi:hypothetical protein
MKFATFIAAPAEQTCSEFQKWFAIDFLPRLVEAAPTMRGCVYRQVRDSPGTPVDKISRVDSEFGSFDILMESWFSSAEDFRRDAIPILYSLKDISARHISYRVTSRLQMDPRVSEAGSSGRRPAITVICSMQWADTVTPAEAAALWDRHAGIALRCQTSITKYEQNIVDEVMCWTPGIKPVDAFADFSFRAVTDCQQGFRSTPEERQDVSGFVQAGRFSYLDDARPAASS